MIRKGKGFTGSIKKQLAKLTPAIEQQFKRKAALKYGEIVELVQKAMDDVIYNVDPHRELNEETARLEDAMRKPDVSYESWTSMYQRRDQIARIQMNLWNRTRALRDSVQVIEDPDGDFGVFAGGHLLVQLSEMRKDMNKNRRGWPQSHGRNYAPYTAGKNGSRTTNFSKKGWYDPARQMVKFYIMELAESGYFQ